MNRRAYLLRATHSDLNARHDRLVGVGLLGLNKSGRAVAHRSYRLSSVLQAHAQTYLPGSEELLVSNAPGAMTRLDAGLEQVLGGTVVSLTRARLRELAGSFPLPPPDATASSARSTGS